MSPASSESVQSSGTDYPYQLEKVSSYLQSDDFEDGSIAMRPARAYSVGSRSDTSSTGKSRIGKNRLEAVQETFRNFLIIFFFESLMNVQCITKFIPTFT